MAGGLERRIEAVERSVGERWAPQYRLVWSVEEQPDGPVRANGERFPSRRAWGEHFREHGGIVLRWDGVEQPEQGAGTGGGI